MSDEDKLKQVELVLNSCITEKQVYTTINWLYRLRFPLPQEDFLLNKAQEKTDRMRRDTYDEAV